MRQRTLLGLWTALALTGCDIGPERDRMALPPLLHGLPGSSLDLTVHPFGAGPGPDAFSWFQRGQGSFPDAIQALVAERLQNPLLQARIVQSPLAAGIAAGGQRYDVTFFANGVQIFGTHMSATLLNDGAPFVLGSLPAITPRGLAAASANWPDVDRTHGVIAAHLAAPGSDLSLTYGKETAYYFATNDDRLVPAWRVITTVGGLPFEVLATDDRVLSVANFYYDVDGSAKIYENNVDDKLLTAYSLTDLAGDGTLTNEYLTTVVPPGYQQAVEKDEVFNFAPTDQRFPEVMSFCHTDDHLKWMLGEGGQTYGDLPIHILMHQMPGGTTNNALFIPGDATSGQPFQIIVGDGDGHVLQNLGTDRDVPSHESGHYIIYNYLKATTGESLAIHEGMADLLVFLQQDNPCLGKSICPAGSTACIQPGQCLRTAANTYAYNDTNWQSWLVNGQCCGHKHGQVLSGLVWDLVKNSVMSSADAAKLTFKAISLFKANSGLHDYLLALLVADREVFQCQYDAKLRQFMAARNLMTLIPDASPGCASEPLPNGTAPAPVAVVGPVAPAAPTATATIGSATGVGAATVSTATAQDIVTAPAPTPAVPPGPKSNGRSSTTACGVVSGPSPPAGGLGLLLLGALPLLISGLSRRRLPACSRKPDRPS